MSEDLELAKKKFAMLEKLIPVKFSALAAAKKMNDDFQRGYENPLNDMGWQQIVNPILPEDLDMSELYDKATEKLRKIPD